MSVLKLQPFINFNDDVKPPVYTHELEKGYIEPPNDQIISLRSGKVLSFYGELTWDLTPYTNEQTILYFKNIPSLSLILEAKRFTYLYMTFGQGRLKTLPSARTISIKFQIIKYFCIYAFKRKKSLSAVLENEKLLRHFIIDIGRNSPSVAAALKTLLELLKRISFNRSGFLYKYNKTNEKLLLSISKKYKDSLEQTLMIPVSIYAFAAKYRWAHVSIITEHKENLLGFLELYVNNKAFAVALKYDVPIKDRVNFVSWKLAVKQFNLNDLFLKYNVSSRKNFSNFLFKIQGTCRHLLHQYTGMRDSECKLLTNNCWQDKTSEMPPLILGHTSKLQGVKTPQVWVTHQVIKSVIDILYSISKRISKVYCQKLKDSPLLVRTGLIRNSTTVNHFTEAISTHNNNEELPIDEKEIIITKEHIDELKAIEPNRNFDNHEWIKVGAPWRFKSHQYRRSLAIYALGSGLVSLYAIKEQFGHLLSSMTSYYGNGYKSARKLNGRTDDREHISNYIHQIKYAIQGLSFIKNVILSESPLFSANGIFLEKHVVAKTDKDRQLVMKRTPQLIKKFESGILHYYETTVGGCTTPSPCEKFLLPDFYISCIGCEYSIHKLEKIEKLAKKQTENAMKWAKRAPNSIEHRTAVKRSIAINEFRDRLRKKTKKLQGKYHEHDRTNL